MNMKGGLKSLVALCALFIAAVRVRGDDPPPGSIVMKVVNQAGAPIELFWVNTFEPSRPLVRQTQKPIRNSSDTQINSYNTHQFMVKFLKEIPGTEATFAKGPKEEKIYVTYEPSKGLQVKQITKYDEVLEKVKSATASCSNLAGEKYSDCMANAVVGDLVQQSESKTKLQKYHSLMSNRLRNYTCADEKMETSKPLRSEKIHYGGKPYSLDILFDTPSAKIWGIENFITDDECAILEKHAKPKLQRATVAGEDGNSIVSPNRRANQAVYDGVEKSGDNDPLYPLYDRALAFANGHGGFEMSFAGQEGFTIIQYGVSDEYHPHCDGDCTGESHISGGRVATVVLYCQTAVRGGGTTFSKADVFVKPKKGMATFFTYKGPDGKMDEGYTEHSGCPVLEGEKWIATLWMREGVSEEEPWTIFDPSGIRILPERPEEAGNRANAAASDDREEL